jgi:hypothetical protein
MRSPLVRQKKRKKKKKIIKGYDSATIIAYVVVNATIMRTRPLLNTYMLAGKLPVCLCHFT